jgi:hypothetical protein
MKDERDDVPLPRPRAVAVPDLSYAARAEQLFNETRHILSREEQAELLHPGNGQ